MEIQVLFGTSIENCYKHCLKNVGGGGVCIILYVYFLLARNQRCKTSPKNVAFSPKSRTRKRDESATF